MIDQPRGKGGKEVRSSGWGIQDNKRKLTDSFRLPKFGFQFLEIEDSFLWIHHDGGTKAEKGRKGEGSSGQEKVLGVCRLDHSSSPDFFMEILKHPSPLLVVAQSTASHLEWMSGRGGEGWGGRGCWEGISNPLNLPPSTIHSQSKKNVYQMK